MPKIYSRNCDVCRKFYRGVGEQFCNTKCAGKGRIPWHRGKNGVYSKEALNKMALAKTGKIGEAAPRWLGDRAGYSAIHVWLRVRFGKAKKCEGKDCSRISKNYQWANISGCYTHNRLSFIQLCASCHKIMDLKYASRKS